MLGALGSRDVTASERIGGMHAPTIKGARHSSLKVTKRRIQSPSFVAPAQLGLCEMIPEDIGSDDTCPMSRDRRGVPCSHTCTRSRGKEEGTS